MKIRTFSMLLVICFKTVSKFLKMNTKKQFLFNKILLLSLLVLGWIQLDAQDAPKPMKMKSAMTEQWSPEPEVITPGMSSENAFIGAPSDAIILFDGKDLSAWQNKEGNAAEWTVENGAFTVKKGTGDIFTKSSFQDFQLHIEWYIPADITGSSQARGNSGIFLQNMYEIQLLDSYQNKTYVNGQAGSVYKQSAPLVNAMRKPGEWNEFDIIYSAPRFNENGSLYAPARVTIIHNGVVIQNNTQITGHTPNTGLPRYKVHGKGPIRLQDHRDPSAPISFRNIWIREM